MQDLLAYDMKPDVVDKILYRNAARLLGIA
jgi:predicted TIM-barrel fold metal-dependent hydrolase